MCECILHMKKQTLFREDIVRNNSLEFKQKLLESTAENYHLSQRERASLNSFKESPDWVH